MADISKVTALDGVTYNVKDATARTSITNLEKKISDVSTPEYALGVDATTNRMALYHYEEV